MSVFDIDTLIHREYLWVPASLRAECVLGESGRVRACVRAHGIADAKRSDARVAKNGDPRLKTEQLQGMQRIAAHTLLPAVDSESNTRTTTVLRLDHHVTRVRYGKVAPIIVAYPDNSDDYLVDQHNMLLSARLQRQTFEDSNR